MSQAPEVDYLYAHICGVIKDAKNERHTIEDAAEIIWDMVLDTPDLIPLIKSASEERMA